MRILENAYSAGIGAVLAQDFAQNTRLIERRLTAITSSKLNLLHNSYFGTMRLSREFR